MKPSKTKPAQAAPKSYLAIWCMTAAAVVLALFWAYGPAMSTGFLFDDTVQKFALPSASDPIGSWAKTTVRPVLMLSYFLNTRISVTDTTSFHVANLLIHVFTGGMVFLILLRLLEWAEVEAARRVPWALAGTALFLLHPLQSESVAYISGRSDSLCGMFCAAALAVFLRPRDSAQAKVWLTNIAAVFLFVAAVGSKEQAIALPAVFLLTDLWWNPGSRLRAVLSNWLLYGLLALGAAGAIALFLPLILGKGTGGTAGAALKDFTWYQYLFTQFRALLTYVGNFILPVNLCLDWDFPISHTIFDHGAIVGLVVLLAAAAAASRYRRTFPLAGYGFFLWLILLSPTSSVMKIQDPIADRRMYLPILGLILIVIDVVRRFKLEPRVFAGCAAALLLAATLATHARAEVWSAPIPLWEDTAAKSPNKVRAHFQLAYAYMEQGRGDLSVAEFEKTAKLKAPNADLLVDWALAYDSINQPGKALEKLNQAALLGPSAHVFTQIGYMHAKRADWTGALAALDRAEKIDPSFAYTYMYRGQVFLAQNQAARAVAEFRHALQLDPHLSVAIEGLATAQRVLGMRR